MISILSSPKAFMGLAHTIQKNAIRSWLVIHPDVEVILYGDSEGTRDIAKELRINHVEHIETSEYGTPLFNAIADHARINARYDLQVYINCDIILTPSFLNTLQRVKYEQFLMIGQRFDLNEGASWCNKDENWREQLEQLSDAGRISLHAPSGSDYFVYRRGLWDDLPPITVGRGGYDNALIKFALEHRIPVIDATISVQVIHQYHGYGHMINGRQGVFEGPEALANRQFAGLHGVPALTDSTWVVDNEKIMRNYSRGDWMRYFECQSRFVYKSELLGFVFRQFRRVLLSLGISKQKNIKQEDILNIMAKQS